MWKHLGIQLFFLFVCYHLSNDNFMTNTKMLLFLLYSHSWLFFSFQSNFWPFLVNKVCWQHSEDSGTTSATISSKRGRDWPLGGTGAAGDLSYGQIRGSFRNSAHQVNNCNQNIYLLNLLFYFFLTSREKNHCWCINFIYLVENIFILQMARV